MTITVSNATVDTAAAAVASPYGPLTRVTDLTLLATPNYQTSIEFTTSLGQHVWLTWEQLANTTLTVKLLKQFSGHEALVRGLKTRIGAVNTTAAAMSSPYDYDDYQTLINALRDNFPEVRGM